jgi:hypothetical protein
MTNIWIIWGVKKTSIYYSNIHTLSQPTFFYKCTRVYLM